MRLRLSISVEGQTEEAFVKRLLAPYLDRAGIEAVPTIVATSRTATGAKVKGGGINIDRVSRELRRLLHSYADGWVTCFYDFYGFEDRKPGEAADALQTRMAAALNRPRNFIPYVQMHEFEALLLSDPAAVAAYFQRPDLKAKIDAAVRRAGSPEGVNDGSSTAPSKRLQTWTSDPKQFIRYSPRTKTRHGPSLAQSVGLDSMRSACPRFAAWIGRLERLCG